MKLKELLSDIFSNGPLDFTSMNNGMTYSDYMLDKNYLEMFKDMILQCEEFESVTELIIPDRPVFLIDGVGTTCETIKMVDNMKIRNRCYLYSISITPEIYDPTTMNHHVKNGASLTPIMYNLQTFIPYKEIRMSWSPELVQDVRGWGVPIQDQEIDLRQRLHQTLDDMLDNPHEYLLKGERGVIIRGIFDFELRGDENIKYNVIL